MSAADQRRPALAAGAEILLRILLRVVGRINAAVAAVVTVLSAAIVAVIMLALFSSAATRYVTGTGYDWLVELPPMLIPWLVFPLLGQLLRQGAHIRVDVLPAMLKPRGRAMLRLLCNVVALAAAAVFMIAGVEAVALFRALGQVAELEVEFPIWYMYLAFPVGFVVFASFALELILRDLVEVFLKPAGPPPSS